MTSARHLRQSLLSDDTQKGYRDDKIMDAAATTRPRSAQEWKNMSGGGCNGVPSPIDTSAP